MKNENWDPLTNLEQPTRWKKARDVVVWADNDLFCEDVPDVYIANVFSVMACCQRHTFRVFTTNPARMYKFLGSSFSLIEIEIAVRAQLPALYPVKYPIPNIFLGVVSSGNNNQGWPEQPDRQRTY
jgi:hypothetical protein